MRFKRINAAVIVLVLAFGLIIATPTKHRKFDEFGDINCEDEMARLDNFAVQLRNEPSATGVIIFYGGQSFRGRLPKQGEAAARAARLKPYLVDRRGIPAERIVIINGGYKAEFLVELWINPASSSLPGPDHPIPAKDIKFQKGNRANPRNYRCQI